MRNLIIVTAGKISQQDYNDIIDSAVKFIKQDTDKIIEVLQQNMEEAAEADYVVILDSGRITAKGTPLELKNKYTGDFVTLYNVDKATVEKLNVEYEEIRDAYRFVVKNTRQATELILKYPEIFVDYEITKGKMDDVFLSVTGKKLEGGTEK